MKGIAELTLPHFAFFRTLSAEPIDGDGKQWNQLAIAGDWFNVRHGEVPITVDDLKTMFDNWSNGVYPQEGVNAPIDYEHLSTKPDRKPGDGEAAGWIESVELRNEGRELWGLVDWVKDAVEKIRAKKYKYFSPTFHRNWTAHGNKKIGPVLLGGALTNYPTLPLQSVQCAVLFANAEDIPLSDRERRVHQALEARFPASMRNGEVDWNSQAWPRYVYDDRVCFSRGGKDLEIKYEFDDDLSVVFDGEPYDVIVSTKPVTFSSEGSMKVKTAKGDVIDLNPADLGTLTLEQLSEIPAVKTLRDKADKAPDTVTLDGLRTDITSLSQAVNLLKTTNDSQAVTLSALQTENAALKAEKTTARIDLAIRKGQILPAERETFVTLSQSASPEGQTAFNALMTAREAAQPLVKLDSIHSVNAQNANGGVVDGTNDPSVKFDQVCREYMATNKCSYADAVRECGRLHKELAQASRDSETPVFSNL